MGACELSGLFSLSAHFEQPLSLGLGGRWGFWGQFVATPAAHLSVEFFEMKMKYEFVENFSNSKKYLDRVWTSRATKASAIA